MKKTIVDLFEQSVKLYPNNTFLLEKTGKEFEPTTYTQVKEHVYNLGAGLQALGVKKGDKIGKLQIYISNQLIFSQNIYTLV